MVREDPPTKPDCHPKVPEDYHPKVPDCHPKVPDCRHR
jgi:hypothetical protein